MASRLSLHAALESILGSNKVYFQPPETKKLSYPCIVYERMTKPITTANNKSYKIDESYKITLIQKTPEDDFVKEIINAFVMIRHDQHYAYDNLYHDIFTLYY